MKLIGSYAPDFEIPGVDGDVHHLGHYLKEHQAVSVVFLSNQCPYVQRYLQHLCALQTEFSPHHVAIIGINPNDSLQNPAESFETMKQQAQEWSLNFPYLWDSTQDVAVGFGVRVTPHAFVIDGNGKLCYSGAIDDGVHGDEDADATKPYLRQAIAAVLDGQTIHPEVTEPVGTPVQWRSQEAM